MKKSSLLILLTSVLTFTSCGGNDNPLPKTSDFEIDAQAKIVSHFGDNFAEDEIDDNFYYADSFFFKDSSEINYSLAVASAIASGASYITYADPFGNKIKDLLEELEFEDVTRNIYMDNAITLDNSIGVIAGHKTLVDDNHKTYTLLSLFTRNGGYGAEWYGNFDVGVSGMHKGFKEARDEMLRFTKKYIQKYRLSGDLKLWVAGYSRGAAVCDAFGGYVANNSDYFGSQVKIEPKNLYVYNIATPANVIEGLDKATVLSVTGPRRDFPYSVSDTNVPAYIYTGEGEIELDSHIYDGIHNFIAHGDLVPMLPPEKWGFTRFGEVIDIEYGDEAFRNCLSQYSEEMAKEFKDKNYSTEMSKVTIDLVKGELVELNEKVSPADLIEERLDALFDIKPTREDIVSGGYTGALGSFLACWGLDSDFILNLISDLSSVLKAGALSYIDHYNTINDYEDKEGFANFVMDLLALMGKEVANRDTYTDQMLLKDVFDYLINDFQNGGDALTRARNIFILLPEPYNVTYLGLLITAQTEGKKIYTVDDFLGLVGRYFSNYPEDEGLNELASLLASKVPSMALSALAYLTGGDYSAYSEEEKAFYISKDLLICCGTGSLDGSKTDKYIRYALLTLSSLFLAITPNLYNLVLNGAYENGETPIVKEPVSLSTLLGDVIYFLAQGEDKTIKELANEALVAVLENGRNSITSDYIDIIENSLEEVKEMLVKMAFNPGDIYFLKEEISNGITFFKNILFLIPAHNHEMYIAYLKSKIVK